MRLRAPLQHCCDRGDPHAGADIARQIDDAGTHVRFFPRHVRERGDVDGNKQECQAKPLQHARAYRMTIVQLQIQPAITKSEEATTMQPNPISNLVSTLDTKKPTTGIMHIITAPPGDSASPASSAV